MCCFPLAEELNKRKTYFSHELGAGFQYAGGNGHEVWKVFQFFLLPATWPDLPTQEVLVVLYKVFQFFLLPATWPDLPTQEVLVVLYKVIQFFLF